MNLYRANGLNNILRYCMGRGITQYDKNVVDEFVTESYEKRLLCKAGLRDLRKSAEMINDVKQTGKLTWHVSTPWKKRVPHGEFSVAVNAFRRYLTVYGGIVENSIRSNCNAVEKFLCFLEDSGFISFSDLSLESLSGKITEYTRNYKRGGLIGVLKKLRKFFVSIGSADECDFRTHINFGIAIPIRASYHREVRRGFDVEQINKIIEVIPTETLIGKRDYAMIRLAATTGLRACDITALKFENIDWRIKTINIIQSKTLQPVTTIITPQVGNAIADYILNARPKSDSPYIFLPFHPPYRKLSTDGISGRVRQYARETEAVKPPQDCGFHNFRRGLGNRLLCAHTSFEMISEVLGQKYTLSAKKYASAHNAELKSCSLSLEYVKRNGIQ